MKIPAKLSFFNRVPFEEKLIFTKHLDTMIKAGIPITEAIETLEEQTRSSYFRKVLTAVLDDIKNGKSLASSLAKHPKAFDQFFVSLIEVSEESGTLEENLSFLALQLSKDFRLRKKIQSALLYPAIVVMAIFGVGGFVSFYVLPKLVDFFESFEIELPLTTKILLFIATAMKNYGVLIILVIIFLPSIFSATVQLPFFKKKWHAILLKFPIIGKLIAYGQLARFSRNLGTLIKSGVPISKSLDITADTLSNLKFKYDLQEVTKSLTKGKNIGATLKQKKYSEFPPIVGRMIDVGERTGKLDETLLYLGEFYDEEIEDISKNLATVLEPILLIIIGIAVGFVALAIISPIYELTGSIRR